MNELAVDLWEIECDVRCITTNGTVKADGANIMGGGCAREAAERHPGLPFAYGSLIRRFGNHVYLTPYGLVMFPTKDTIQDRASTSLIAVSARELVALANLYAWKHVALPRPGAGLGGLDYDLDVRPVLAPILDSRFTIIDFPSPKGAPA